jgi:ABC-type multidrug transport system ATPase subunit
MEIIAQGVGKQFGNEWIIKNFNHHFEAHKACVILGGNGSGKSTLLKIISGFMQPGSGSIIYKHEQVEIDKENIHREVSYAAPYLELIEEFTCLESILFHQKFKPFVNQLSATEVLELSGLQHAAHKELKVFSSGMKQRLKLTLAILSNCKVLLLDEPCANLDAKAIDWYQQMIETYASTKLMLVCSNHLTYEYEFCKEQINTETFKSNNVIGE